MSIQCNPLADQAFNAAIIWFLPITIILLEQGFTIKTMVNNIGNLDDNSLFIDKLLIKLAYRCICRRCCYFSFELGDSFFC